MSTTTLNHLLTQVNQLPLAERKQLKEQIRLDDEPSTSLRDLDQPSKPVAPSFKTKDRTKEYEWLQQNRRAYIGQWIALEGDRLLAHSYDYKEVFAKVKELGVERPYLLFVEDPDVPFVGI